MVDAVEVFGRGLPIRHEIELFEGDVPSLEGAKEIGTRRDQARQEEMKIEVPQKMLEESLPSTATEMMPRWPTKQTACGGRVSFCLL